MEAGATLAPRRIRDGVAWRPATVGVTAALAALYGPVLRDLVGLWSIVPYYSYGFLIAPWSAWLAASARPGPADASASRDPADLALAAGGVGVLALGRAFDSLTLAALSLPLVLAGLGRLVLGHAAFAPVAFPVAFLALMTPLPPAVVPPLSWLLQHLATSFTTVVLGVLGIPFWREDVFIHLRGATVHVSEACNGLRFLLAMAVLGVAFAWAIRRGLAARVLVVVLALAAAVAANLVRVSATTVLVDAWGPAAALDPFHNLFGKAIYLAVVALFFLAVLRFRK